MKQTKISVVTVCYNEEKSIERTIKSVLNQKYDNFEYYILDGKSSDNTIEVIKSIICGKRKVYLISENDNGLYNAMNKAISSVNGEWVIFLNAGDTFYDENVLTKASGYLYDGDFIYGDCSYQNSGGDFIVNARSIEKIKTCMPFCHEAVFNRVDTIKELLYNEKYRIVADYDCYLRAYRHGFQFRKIPICICTYEEGGLSYQFKDVMLKEIRDVQIENGITAFPRIKYVIGIFRSNLGELARSCISVSLLNKVRAIKCGRRFSIKDR